MFAFDFDLIFINENRPSFGSIHAESIEICRNKPMLMRCNPTAPKIVCG